jgi:hypothetical protein
MTTCSPRRSSSATSSIDGWPLLLRLGLRDRRCGDLPARLRRIISTGRIPTGTNRVFGFRWGFIALRGALRDVQPPEPLRDW